MVNIRETKLVKEEKPDLPREDAARQYMLGGLIILTAQLTVIRMRQAPSIKSVRHPTFVLSSQPEEEKNGISLEPQFSKSTPKARREYPQQMKLHMLIWRCTDQTR